jgi:hypothetical protein
MHQHKRILWSLSLFLLVFIAYVSLYFSSFINYYTKGAYAFTTLTLSLSFMLSVFKDYFNFEGVLIFTLIIYGNLVFSRELSSGKKHNVVRLLLPFVIFFSFIILYLKSTNVPHIMSIMAFLCTIAFVSLKFNIRCFSFSKRISLRMIGLVVVGLVFFNLFSIRSQRPIDQYVSQKKVVSYLKSKLIKEPKLKFRCFYDSAIEIPIIVTLFKENNFFYSFESVFNVQDVFYPNSINFHYNELISSLNDVDIVIINSTSKNKIQLGKKASIIQRKLRYYFQNNSNYRLRKIIPSNYYSDLYVYEFVK